MHHSMAPLLGALRLRCLLFWLQVPTSQPFHGTERSYGPEGNATLPPDWKHLGAPPQEARGKRGQLLGRWQPCIWGSALGGGEDQRDPFPWLSRCLVSRRGADGPELQLQLQLQPGEVLRHGYQWDWEWGEGGDGMERGWDGEGMGWRGEGGWDLNRTHVGMAALSIVVMGTPLPPHRAPPGGAEGQRQLSGQ